jgi:hypothetical protein
MTDFPCGDKMKKSIFKQDRKYTFRDYFEMNSPTDEIAAEFGYTYSLEVIDLPTFEDYNRDAIEKLNETYLTILPRITLTSEIARREFLIAPLLVELIKTSSVKINVEYPLEVDDKLSGLLDYLLKAKHKLIVIEAKKGDLDKGFNQLTAEMIALDKYEDDNSEKLYGAITVGNIWNFGYLDRNKKHIVKNIYNQTIPEDTQEIFSILLGIINN